jgi:hypothetical protein
LPEDGSLKQKYIAGNNKNKIHSCIDCTSAYANGYGSLKMKMEAAALSIMLAPLHQPTPFHILRP